jgi:hypothetical protein
MHFSKAGWNWYKTESQAFITASIGQNIKKTFFF